jgi:hypothetical protein
MKFKNAFVLRLFVVLSSLVVIAHNPVLADPAAEVLGTYRNTDSSNGWMAKYLGASSDWEAGRSYTDGILDYTGYVEPGRASGMGLYLITPPSGPAGYYSFVTTINDSGLTNADPTLSFSGLYTFVTPWVGANVEAVVINGAIYDDFTMSYSQYFSHYSLAILPDGNIPWNISGNNTIEIIATGMISASIQAHYAPIPEPETWAMLLAGLGIVGAISKRRRRQE